MLLCEPQSLEPCLGAFNLVQREGTVPHEGKPVPCSYGPQDPSALLAETSGLTNWHAVFAAPPRPRSSDCRALGPRGGTHTRPALSHMELSTWGPLGIPTHVQAPRSGWVFCTGKGLDTSRG